MSENGTIINVGNPNRLVKYAIRHQNEDYFYNEDTGEIKRGGKMIFGEPWYYITPEMYPFYENGRYAGNMLWGIRRDNYVKKIKICEVALNGINQEVE